MKKSIIIVCAVLLMIFISGCTTGGSFLAHNVTTVELAEPNFNYVAKNLEGHSFAAYLFGVTYSMGTMSNTLALVRVNGTAKLYDDAIQDIWKKYKEKYGETEGKRLALVNIRIDNDMLNLLVYTKTELYITADVIEFVE